MIRVRGLRVQYEDVVAVDDLDLDLEAGMIYGLIGPNGAGKTSTIKVLSTLLRPIAGDVRIDGIDVLEEPRRVTRVLGYMPDFSPIFDDVTVHEFLEIFARAYGLGAPGRARRIPACLELTDLEDKRDALASELSRGMKQRLVLARTLLHDPKVLFLDEPASGLDPLARIEFRAILRELGALGKTVLVSSHILTELSDYCNAIGIMERGRMVESGRIEELLERMAPPAAVTVVLAAPDPRLDGFLAASELVASHELGAGGAEARAELAGGPDTLPELLAALVEGGFRVRSYVERRHDIEDIFLELGSHATA